MASNGEIDILDVIPKKIHQRSPLFLGSQEDVQEVLQYIKKYKDNKQWKEEDDETWKKVIKDFITRHIIC